MIGVLFLVRNIDRVVFDKPLPIVAFPGHEILQLLPPVTFERLEQGEIGAADGAEGAEEAERAGLLGTHHLARDQIVECSGPERLDGNAFILQLLDLGGRKSRDTPDFPSTECLERFIEQRIRTDRFIKCKRIGDRCRGASDAAQARCKPCVLCLVELLPPLRFQRGNQRVVEAQVTDGCIVNGHSFQFIGQLWINTFGETCDLFRELPVQDGIENLAIRLCKPFDSCTSSTR